MFNSAVVVAYKAFVTSVSGMMGLLCMSIWVFIMAVLIMSALLMMSALYLCVNRPFAINCPDSLFTTSYMSTHSSVISTDLTRAARP